MSDQRRMDVPFGSLAVDGPDPFARIGVAYQIEVGIAELAEPVFDPGLRIVVVEYVDIRIAGIAPKAA